MPWSALPEWIDEAREWGGTDWDWWGQRWLLKIKGLFAYGPRADEEWARWREWPITIFAVRGRGYFRTESERWERDSSFSSHDTRRTIVFWKPSGEYLSGIQYWCRWHFAVQWPFQIQFHAYLRGRDVPEVGDRPEGRLLIFFRIGARRDADKVYWFPSAALTRTFN